MSETPESRPSELFQEEIARLRGASGWARFIAIGGFIVAGVVGLTLGLVFAGRDRVGVTPTVILMWIVRVVFVAAAAQQLLGYSRGVRAFLANDGPALARAFRSLRHVFRLSCLYVAFMVVMEVLSLLRVW